MKYLTIRRHRLSFQFRMQIHDYHKQLRYESFAEMVNWQLVWHVCREHCPVLTLRKPLLSPRTAWHVSGNMQDYLIRQNLNPFNRHYNVEGGPFCGAHMRGNVADRTFEVVKAGAILATAANPALCLPDKYQVEIADDSPDTVLFLSLMMIVAHTNRPIGHKRLQPGEKDLPWPAL